MVGVAGYYAFAGVIAVAVGAMVRHAAAVLMLLLGYAMIAESLVQAVPGVGAGIYRWLPFNVAKQFLIGAPDPGTGQPAAPALTPSTSSLPPWWALAYYLAFALVLLAIAACTAKRRDARRSSTAS
ncbi:hypothetical protein [Nonomuraea sp. NPDC001831]|uniref:hypothetical protein n=1 Tax=Nonomuraea sp. NPDC001831 TaxID=3364340 RepID=UPI0036C89AEE